MRPCRFYLRTNSGLRTLPGRWRRRPRRTEASIQSCWFSRFDVWVGLWALELTDVAFEMPRIHALNHASWKRLLRQNFLPVFRIRGFHGSVILRLGVTVKINLANPLTGRPALSPAVAGTFKALTCRKWADRTPALKSREEGV